MGKVSSVARSRTPRALMTGAQQQSRKLCSWLMVFKFWRNVDFAVWTVSCEWHSSTLRIALLSRYLLTNSSGELLGTALFTGDTWSKCSLDLRRLCGLPPKPPGISHLGSPAMGELSITFNTVDAVTARGLPLLKLYTSRSKRKRLYKATKAYFKLAKGSW